MSAGTVPKQQASSNAIIDIGESPPFSIEARRKAGYLLRLLQRGEALSMPHSRPMVLSIDPGCHELRINDRDQTWRIVYFLDADAVYVLDVFSKKTQAMPDEVKRRCRRRLRDLQQTLGG